MNIHILSLFPEMFTGVFGSSMMKKAQEKREVAINITNFRDFSGNKHHKVDDYPYGGGAGMVLKAEPIFEAVESLLANNEKKARIILLCPQGERFTQQKAEELATEDELIFICGHYEGYDERIREHLVTDEISIGDFVLTGGEIAAMTIVDSVVRLLPNVLGNAESHEKDSFSTGLLEHPQYTRPVEYRGYKVPDVLMSGNHAEIEKWRREQSLKRTIDRRPELLESANLSEKDLKIIKKLKEQ